MAALAFLRGRPEIDKNRLFVLGHSLGGTVAPRIAQAEPRPAGIILLAPSGRLIHRLIPEHCATSPIWMARFPPKRSSTSKTQKMRWRNWTKPSPVKYHLLVNPWEPL